MIYSPKILMQEAICEAEKAFRVNEVPVGAVIFDNLSQKIISRGHNLVEKMQNKLMHAEIVAINRMFEFIKNKYVGDYSIFVTLEPCLACMGAILNSGIKKIYYAADDYKCGAMNGSNHEFFLKSKDIQIYQGIKEAESKRLLSAFFKKLRQDRRLAMDSVPLF